jgi:hypothetical protein
VGGVGYGARIDDVACPDLIFAVVDLGVWNLVSEPLHHKLLSNRNAEYLAQYPPLSPAFRVRVLGARAELLEHVLKVGRDLCWTEIGVVRISDVTPERARRIGYGAERLTISIGPVMRGRHGILGYEADERRISQRLQRFAGASMLE